VLILDEPTRGIDVGTKADVHARTARLARQVVAILMISLELPEILGTSHHILVIRGGRASTQLKNRPCLPRRGKLWIQLSPPLERRFTGSNEEP
jgi:rhamnose transport system ATP-binding protein